MPRPARRRRAPRADRTGAPLDRHRALGRAGRPRGARLPPPAGRAADHDGDDHHARAARPPGRARRRHGPPEQRLVDGRPALRRRGGAPRRRAAGRRAAGVPRGGVAAARRLRPARHLARGDHVRAPPGRRHGGDHRLPRVVREELPAVQGLGRAVDRPSRRDPHDPPDLGRRGADPRALDVAADRPAAARRVAARGGGPRHGEPLPGTGGDRSGRRRGGRERRPRGAALVARLAHVALGRYAPLDGADAPGSRARTVERRRGSQPVAHVDRRLHDAHEAADHAAHPDHGVRGDGVCGRRPAPRRPRRLDAARAGPLVGRRERDQPLPRSRHRRPDDAYRGAAAPERPGRPGGGARLRRGPHHRVDGRARASTSTSSQRRSRCRARSPTWSSTRTGSSGGHRSTS